MTSEKWSVNDKATWLDELTHHFKLIVKVVTQKFLNKKFTERFIEKYEQNE